MCNHDDRDHWPCIGTMDSGQVVELVNCPVCRSTLSRIGIGPSPYAEDYADALSIPGVDPSLYAEVL